MLVILCGFCLALASCSADLTEQFLPLDIVNDTNAEMIVDQCDVKCNLLHDHADLKPGQIMGVNVSDANVPEWFVVTTPDGKRVGCLLAQFSHKESSARIGLSKTRPCPADVMQ
jgi:hypothetical protein